MIRELIVASIGVVIAVFAIAISVMVFSKNFQSAYMDRFDLPTAARTGDL